MWSPILLCALASFAFASNNPGWREGTEYVYKVRGRTLASLHEAANQYSGLFMKAKLHLNPQSDGALQARISEPRYAQINSDLPDGWETDIPESELSYKPLALSKKPFRIVMEDGIVQDLIVEKDISNWEANILKSIVSQFQLDTKAKNAVPSYINKLPRSNDDDAVFKTMEDTITGTTETLYEIHPLPEHILQAQPWLAPKSRLEDNENVIEVVKHKNYSRSIDQPAYHFGFGNADRWEPAANQIADFLVRNSLSRSILTGNLNRYTIQNTYTVNEIMANPTLNNKEKGSVVSVLNLTLVETKKEDQKRDELSQPVSLGNLVYSYTAPFDPSNEVQTNQPHELSYFPDESDTSSESSEERQERIRMQNSLGRFRSAKRLQSSSSRNPITDEEYYQTQDTPQWSKAPKTPLLAYMMAYHGGSIKNDRNFDVQKNAEKLAQEIGEDLKHPQQLLEKDALSKYLILARLVRLMDSDEIQQSAQQLYKQSEDSSEHNAWAAFRDAVAEAGTAPALQAIQSWIQDKKVESEEGAELIAQAAAAARQPTEEYMKKFFEFVKKIESRKESSAYQAALLAYTNLCRRVYVNKYESHNQYPVHSFGSFRTEEGERFLTETVIPHLSNQLKEAIRDADTQQIHLAIRALGNIAHKRILEAFEPYLEGRKQASQFQRLMMVVAMDNLAESNPVAARSVLLKIYQNTGDAQEVRAAAVHQVMRTSPPTDVLQRMASYTNIDSDELVNAVVKSAIENAARLHNSEDEELRSSAAAAKPLLTKETYGAHQGENRRNTTDMPSFRIKYRSELETIGSDDAYLPKSIKYTLRGRFGGMEREQINAEALVSSVDELFNYVEERVERGSSKHNQRSSKGGSKQFSSEKIAKQLNMETDEREQLEGMIRFELGQMERMFSFDNQTLKDLPQAIKRIQNQLKSFKYTKMFNNEDLALSYPTEMGIPFLYAYNNPVLLEVKGSVDSKASHGSASQGSSSRSDKWNIPDKVSLKMNVRATWSTKAQGRLAVVTPFDHQIYMAGYDKNLQAHIPIDGKIEIDIKEQTVEAEFKPKEEHKNAPLLHYSTWPYTSYSDVLSVRPISSMPNTKPITKPREEQHEFDTTIGHKQTGLAFHVRGRHEKHLMGLHQVYQAIANNNGLRTILKLWQDGSIQQRQIDVSFNPDKSTTDKVKVNLNWDQQTQRDENSQSSEKEMELSQLRSENSGREKEIKEWVGKGINNAKIHFYDALVEFEGQRKIKHAFTVAYSESNVDSESRLLAYYQKKTSDQGKGDFEAALQVRSDNPNTNWLDAEYALDKEQNAESEVELHYKANQDPTTKISAKVQMRRSHERARFLKKQPEYSQCKEQMEEGNNGLPECMNITARANFLDQYDIKMKYKNVQPEVSRMIQSVYDMMRMNYYPSIEEEDANEPEDAIRAHVHFNPRLNKVNVTIATSERQVKLPNIPVSEMAKTILVSHQEFGLSSRVQGRLWSIPTVNQMCVVDRKAAQTFDDVVYPSDLDDQWTVMLQYIPERSRPDSKNSEQSVEEQLEEQNENYVVLVRQSPENPEKKDVKIVFKNENRRQTEDVEITLKPTEDDNKQRVTVNGQDVQVGDKRSHNTENNAEIYALPNGEVRVDVEDAFFVVYDGRRAMIAATNGKLRNAARGMCGNFNDDKTDDMITPENCVARDPQDLIDSYKVGDGKKMSKRSNEGRRQCKPKESALYVDVISDEDAGREDENQHEGGRRGESSSCVKLQTRYVEKSGEICFTTRPMPTCQCKQRGTVRKSVDVHCLPKGKSTSLWKKQIDMGGNPNFSNKPATKSIEMDLPQKCSN